MEVTVPLHRAQLADGSGIDDIRRAYASLYTGEIVSYAEGADEGGFLSSGRFSGLDSMDGNEDRILLTARYDNLGKGASGAAVECLNILPGVDAKTGLVLA